MLRNCNVEIRSLKDFPDIPDIEEEGKSFFENALLKARTVSKITGEAVLADDSGLEVDALGGAPGIYSSRYAGPEATPFSRDLHDRMIDLALLGSAYLTGKQIELAGGVVS